MFVVMLLGCWYIHHWKWMFVVILPTVGTFTTYLSLDVDAVGPGQTIANNDAWLPLGQSN